LFWVCVCVCVCVLVLPVLCLTRTVIRFLSRKKVDGETSPQHSQEELLSFFLFF
jgi:phosphate starvation-inducible membrane PsiE